MKNLQILILIVIIFSIGRFVVGQTPITDIDGNVYPTVLIGNQEWMAK